MPRQRPYDRIDTTLGAPATELPMGGGLRPETLARPQRRSHRALLLLLMVGAAAAGNLRCIHSAGEDADSDNRAIIFCVDVSGSMRRQELMTRLKGEMGRFVRDPSKLGTGDWFMLITFGTRVSLVEDRRIRGPEDIDRIQKTIDSLQAGEAHTYVTQALDLTVTQMRKLRDAGYGSQTVAYLFTDGINDPPADVRDPLTFNELFKKWSEEVQLESSDFLIYLVTLGITPERGLLNAQRRFPEQIRLVEHPRAPDRAQPMIPTSPIRLRYSSHFEDPITAGPTIPLSIGIEVLDPSDYEGEEIEFRLEARPAGDLQPARRSAIVRRGGKKALTFELLNAKPGKHTVVLHASPQKRGVHVYPVSKTFELQIVRQATALRVDLDAAPPARPRETTPLPLSIAAPNAPNDWKGRVRVRVESPADCPIEPKSAVAELEADQPAVVSFALVDPGQGKHAVTFHLKPLSGGPVTPARYKAVISVQPPSKWLFWTLVALVAAAVLLTTAALVQLFFFPRFSESLVLETDSGDAWRLRIHQRPWSKGVSASELGIQDTAFELLAQRGNRIFARTAKDQPWRRVMEGAELQAGFRIRESPLPFTSPQDPTGEKS